MDGMLPTLDEIRQVPKVLLHDHLDGGPRPATIVELAAETGYRSLPTSDAGELAAWMGQVAQRGSLELYLEAFQHTVGVMQTREALIRVAAECAEDLAADGVAYAEVRFAPELHTERGLSLDEVVQAVLDGFRQGSEGRGITVYALLTAMRTAARSLEIAELAVRYRDQGVVGFDIAGAEAGWPPSRHLDAFQYIKRENFHITIHAGEGFGLPSIWEAVQYCGTERLGHGVRLSDDIEVSANGEVRLGRLASYVRDRRIPLEMCPSSNVQTGAALVCMVDDSVPQGARDMLGRIYDRVPVIPRLRAHDSGYPRELLSDAYRDMYTKLHLFDAALFRALFAQNGDTQVPNLIVDLAEGFFRKLVRWCESFLESRDAFQGAIDLILWQRSEDSLHVLDLGNAMANHRHIVPCCDGQSTCVLKPIPSKNCAHVEVVRHDETIETEFVAQ